MKILNLICVTVLSASFLVSCSSRKLERDYKVVDASKQDIPEWVSDLDEWKEDNDEENKASFYVYETEPKNSRSISCEIAKARSKSLIAEEVATYIKHSLAQSKEGNPLKDDSKLSEYVEEHLAKEVQTHLVGAKISKTYWEKRRYLKELGAKKDMDAYTCYALSSITKTNLKKAFKRSEEKLANKATSKAVKAKVKELLKDAANAYQ